jgi:penicillin-binding protein 2
VTARRSILAALTLTLFLPSSIFSSKSRDLRLQQAVDRALGGTAVAIVVLDVDSGEILAARNLECAGQQLIQTGSTLKPFVLMELLDSRKLDPKQRLICRRPLRIEGMLFDCSHTTGVTQLDADDAIAYSSNSYVAEAALRMSGDQLAEALRRRGLDSFTGLVKSESTGHIERGTNQEQLQLTSLGVREIEVTPLELLAYGKLALIRRSGNTSTDEAVFLGLEHAITYGTAHAAPVDGMKIAGKTGTASAAHGPRTHGIFFGYAPADRPEIATVVYIPQGRGLDAATVAHSVFQQYRQIKQKL